MRLRRDESLSKHQRHSLIDPNILFTKISHGYSTLSYGTNKSFIISFLIFSFSFIFRLSPYCILFLSGEDCENVNFFINSAVKFHNIATSTTCVARCFIFQNLYAIVIVIRKTSSSSSLSPGIVTI